MGVLAYLIKQTVIRPWRAGQKELAALVVALYFTYAWKGLAYASLGYSLPNAVFVFFSAWFWVATNQNCMYGAAKLDLINAGICNK